MDYNLNQGQKDAAEAFFDFLFTDEKEFIISGPAGVGKTYLMNYIIDNTMPQYIDMCKLVNIDPRYFNVTMTATTNKAAEVLGHATKRPTQTIHSFLGLMIRNDFKTGKTFLDKNRNWTIHRNLIIFIDECSMIDSELLKHIHAATEDCKIVYVGDHCQLAPVNEKQSPVYASGAPFVVLSQPMRNAGQPALQAICAQLRGTVETGVFWPVHVVPGVIEHRDDLGMQAELQNQLLQQTHDVRVLAYTNKRVNEYNDYIRGMRNLPPQFQEGEIVVNTNAFRWGKHMLAVEAEVEITKIHGTHTVTLTDSIQLEVININFIDNFNRHYERVPIPVDMDKYKELTKFFAKKKDWPTYFHLRDEYIDLRPRDAATVHKSQGSTYETVFIDLGDISGCYDAAQVARLLYVAFSRAKNRVILYGSLSQRYGGLIR